MKPNKRLEAPGPEVGRGEKRTGGGKSGPESRPEETGGESGSGHEAGEADSG